MRNGNACDDSISDQELVDSIMKNITKNLGKDFEDVRYDLSTPNDSFFVSEMFFLNVTPNSNIEDTEKSKSLQLVVKRPPRFEFVREVMKSDAQFHNEVQFYKRYVEENDNFPRCVYVDEQPPPDTLIVLENVCARGYELCQWKYDVPLEYTMAAVKELARFHAKGYLMKERQSEKFYEVVDSIWETRFDDFPENTMKITANAAGTRSVEYLREQNYDKDFCDKVDAYLSDCFQNVMLKCIETDEPLSTLCHGDSTLNNMFFKEEDGELKVMLIDFALMRYASPVIDLSTFLCLHCANDIDKDMLEDVLRVYSDCLVRCLRENGMEDCENYSYEAIYEDFKKKGMFGFVIASFFLAMVMGKSVMKPEDMMTTDISEWGGIMRELGGDEVSAILANMLLKFRDIGCLDHVI